MRIVAICVRLCSVITKGVLPLPELNLRIGFQDAAAVVTFHFWDVDLNIEKNFKMAPPTSVVVGRSSTLPSAHQPLPVSNPTPNPQATPLLSSQGVANLAIYYVPRRFDADSKLHRYLARKCPTLIFEGRSDYNLYEVRPSYLWYSWKERFWCSFGRFLKFCLLFDICAEQGWLLLAAI